jgi:colicin import membrane protein
MHALIAAQFSDEQKSCFPKFFATSCLNDAKERHRVALAKVRIIEIEVNKFKRRANVEARDKAQAAKHEHEIDEMTNHEKESRNQASGNEPASSKASSTLPVKVKNNANDRVIKHQTAVNKRQAAESDKAKQRADNIAAYEKKQQGSEARQREIAAKKAEKARSISSKAASESK